jgi:hypothetical protein
LFEKEQTMKLFRALTVIFSLGFALSAGGATLTTDPLTGLPLDRNRFPSSGQRTDENAGFADL